MNFPTSVYDTLFFLKKKIWLVTLIFLGFFFALPINAGMCLQHVQQQGGDIATQNLLKHKIAVLFNAGENLGVTLIFIISAFICALIFLTWMHSRHKVDFYYSLPLNKKWLFGCCFSAGILAVIIPYLINIVLSLIVIATMGQFSLLDASTLLAGMAVNILLFTVIYTLTVIAITLTGNSIVSGLLGLIFLSLGPTVIFLYRIVRENLHPTWFSEAVDWSALISYSSPVSRFISLHMSDQASFTWLEGLLCMLICALFLLAAIRLFKIRAAEAAGKTLAFPLLRPLLKYPLTIICAAAFGMIFHSMGDVGNNWLWFFLGAALGGAIVCQSVEIIYYADFRAINKRLLPMGITLALFLGVCALGIGDVGGYNKYLPQSNEVASVDLLMTDFNSYTYDSDIAQDFPAPHDTNYYQLRPLISEKSTLSKAFDLQNQLELGHIEDPQSIEAAISLADKMIAQSSISLEEEEFYYFAPEKTSCIIRYTLKNGKSVIRSYTNTNINSDQIREEMAQIYQDNSYKKHIYQLFSFSPQQIRVENVCAFASEPITPYNEAQRESNLNMPCTELLQTFQQELTALSGEQMQQELPVGSITFRVYASNPEKIIFKQNNREYLSYTYPVYPSFSRTISLLQDFGVSTQDWYANSDQISKITLSEYNPQGFDQQLPPAFNSQQNKTMITGSGLNNLYQNIPSNSTTYYNMEGKQRSTVFSDKNTIEKMLSQSYPEEAFRFNSFISPYPNSMYSVTYMDFYGNDNYQFRYRLQP